MSQIPEVNLPAEAETRPRPKPFWRDLLETLVLAAFLYFLINTLSMRISVDGSSMVPTLQNGELVLVNRIAYNFGQPQRGEIIVFYSPIAPQEKLIKRVIGLPGETVLISGGQVFVNGTLLNETYIMDAPQYEGEWVVPADSLFVLGDNRNNSSDSHSWNPLPISNVIGKAVLIYWPYSAFGLIDHDPVFASP